LKKLKNKNMFNITKKDNSNISPEKLSLSEDKDLKIEDYPVYTMKRDLENANDPKYATYAFETLPQKHSLPTRPSEIPPVSEKQKTSPFLDSNRENIAQNIVPNLPEPKKIEENSGKLNWGKLMIITIVIFIILLSGAGGYYYWINNNSDISILIYVF
jgi:hypothetical protein